MNQKQKMSVLASGLCLAVAAAGVFAASVGSSGETAYREVTVESGSLAVGIEESGKVDIGTVEQVFELDMSALQRPDTDSASETEDGNRNERGLGAALNMFDQILNMPGNSGKNSTEEDSDLKVSRVLVSAGQQVSAGDALYELEEESVAELADYLESNAEKAKADLEAVYADEKLSRQKAQYTYESSTAYGSYAAEEYSSSIAGLEEKAETAQDALEQAQSTLGSLKERLEDVTASYEEALVVLENCKWSRDHTDKEDSAYNYVYYFQLTQTAQSTADSLEQSREELERSVEQAEKNVETAEVAFNTAVRELEQGKLDAQQTLSLRQLACDTAQETYDIALAYLEDEVSEQERVCREAEEKLKEYETCISKTSICSQYNGVITDVALTEGDSIQTNDVLITLFNMDDVTMTVTVDGKDMQDIGLGTDASISFTAYPDSVYAAEVTEISDAGTDSSGNVTYEVTATLQGDVSGLFQGMTGDITFLTKQTGEVLYISSRAVIREGNKACVKVKNENGTIEKREIVTGFSDGVSVEIVEGLSEGEVVLIESRVSE